MEARLTAAPDIVFRPQPGPQEQYLACDAMIVLFGGSAGGGKTYGTLLDALRFKDDPGFGAVVFRRNGTDIFKEGGLWDQSEEIFPLFGATGRRHSKSWVFSSGAKITFAHLEHEKDRLTYQGAQIRYIAFEELTHFCMHPLTEVLTEHGWSRIGEVASGVKVASMTRDRKIEYVAVKESLSFDFDGDLVCANQRNGVSFAVTPNHRMVVDTQAGDGGWKFVRADHVERTVQTIPRTGKWKGVESAKFKLFSRPTGQGIGANQNSADKVPMDDWLEFLGWYLSEGCAFVSGTSPMVSIRQIAKPDKLVELVARLPWRFKRTKCGQFNCFSRQLFDELKPMGNLYEKRVPRFVFSLPVRQIKLLWDAFVEGDGHRTPRGAIHFGLANEGLVDDLQEMAFLMGLISTKSTGKTRTGFIVHSLSVSKPTRSSTQVKPKSVFRAKHIGKVCCLTVPKNHTFLTRLNGRISWTGNTERQFWYLFSRSRSPSGGRCYIRATCNPDPDSFVRKLVDWWIDPKTGYALKSRSGVVRWFVRDGERLVWASTPGELTRRYPSSRPVSFTFIRSDIYDNPALLAKDPEYLSKLEALSTVEREQLLKGNWNVRPAAGLMFKREWFPVLDVAPRDVLKSVRYWDLASTEKREDNDPDWTSGVKMCSLRDGSWVVVDVRRAQVNPTGVDELMLATAQQDGVNTLIAVEEEGGASGKIASAYLTRMLAGYPVVAVKVGVNKQLRALGLSAQAGKKKVAIVRGAWNEDYLAELENFPDGKNDDQVDGSSGAFSMLTVGGGGFAKVHSERDHRRVGRVEFVRGKVAV